MTDQTPCKRITVRYFASIREALGQGEEALDTPAATLGALRQELLARGGAYAEVLAPGRAVLQMTVGEQMLNGHDICHGGLITTLADAAFAYACNSYNELTVASGFAVDLLAPGRLGDVLTATCHEVSRAGRTGLYDCAVHNQGGQCIAVFRGRSYTVKGKPAVAG